MIALSSLRCLPTGKGFIRVFLHSLLLCLVCMGAFFSSSSYAKEGQPKAKAEVSSSTKIPKSSRKMGATEAGGIVLSSDSATASVGLGKDKDAVDVKGKAPKEEKISNANVKNKAQKKKASSEKKQAKPEKAQKKTKQGVPAKPVIDGALKKAPQPVLSGEYASLAKENKWAEMLSAANRRLSKNKKDGEAADAKIYALSQIGSDEALDQLDDMAESNAGRPALHAARARILERQQDTVEALDAWGKALALAPQDNGYKLGYAKLNDRLGRTDEAIKFYRLVKPLPADAQNRLDSLLSSSSVSDK